MAGVDIGGSHITAALVDTSTGTIVPESWQRDSVPAAGTANEIIDAWSNVILTSFGQSVPARLGIAMPGPFDYEAGICLIQGQHKYESLYGLNIKTLLAQKLGFDINNIRLTNDAACFLQGEIFAGAAKGWSNVTGITLGTGLGSATCINNIVADAAWWNTPFKDGIAEDYLSSRWFVQRYRQLTNVAMPNVKHILATGDDGKIKQVFHEFGIHLGTFLLQQQAKGLVVIGGNIAQAFSLFEQSLKACLLSADNHTEVRQALLGEDAALIGAATAGLEGVNRFSLQHANN